MTALDGYGDFDTKRQSSKPVNTILDKTDVFIFSHFAASEHQTSFSCPLIRYQVSGAQQLGNELFLFFFFFLYIFFSLTDICKETFTETQPLPFRCLKNHLPKHISSSKSFENIPPPHKSISILFEP